MGYKKLEEQEKAKIVFQFSLTLIASVIAGIYFTRLISDAFWADSALRLYSYFKTPFENTAIGFLKNCLRACISDILCISLMFIFSFSFVNYFATDLILLFIGFKYGLNCALIMSGGSSIGIGNSLSFLILKGSCLAVILLYSCRMSFYSLRLRGVWSAGRLRLDRKIIFSATIFTLAVSGVLLLIGALYSFLIFVI